MSRNSWLALAGLMIPLMLGSANTMAVTDRKCGPVLDHRLTTLKGAKQDLCEYQGNVVLVVNTASYCGFTSQYKGLEALSRKYKDQGLVVLGFPSNDFGQQEPGSNQEVAEFCERTYQVKFPMFEKSGVAKGDACPPAALGICRISTVSNRFKSMRAIRGVLFALMNSHRPSCTPSVSDISV